MFKFIKKLFGKTETNVDPVPYKIEQPIQNHKADSQPVGQKPNVEPTPAPKAKKQPATKTSVAKPQKAKKPAAKKSLSK